jgi:hypothetical protein
MIHLWLARDPPLKPLPHWCARDPHDITYDLVSAYPDRPGMTGVKSPRPPLQQAWGAADHYAAHNDTIRTIRAYETTAPTTIPTIRAGSCHISRPRGHGPLRQVKLQGPILHASYRTRYDGARRYNTERQKPLPLAVARMPHHVAAVLGVPTPCLYGADHDTTG